MKARLEFAMKHKGIGHYKIEKRSFGLMKTRWKLGSKLLLLGYSEMQMKSTIQTLWPQHSRVHELLVGSGLALLATKWVFY